MKKEWKQYEYAPTKKLGAEEEAKDFFKEQRCYGVFVEMRYDENGEDKCLATALVDKLADKRLIKSPKIKRKSYNFLKWHGKKLETICLENYWLKQGVFAYDEALKNASKNELINCNVFLIQQARILAGIEKPVPVEEQNGIEVIRVKPADTKDET